MRQYLEPQDRPEADDHLWVGNFLDGVQIDRAYKPEYHKPKLVCNLCVKIKFMRLWSVLGGFVLLAGTIAGTTFYYFQRNTTYHLTSPIEKIDEAALKKQQDLPLEKYSIINLKKYPYKKSRIKIVKQVETKPEDEFTSWIFSYQTMGKTMTGRLNLPSQPLLDNKGRPKVVIMLRGWVPKEKFESGVGAQPAASVFAKNGYITLAPDFFGYGESDPPPENSWEARFIKPINVIELIKTIQESGVPTRVDNKDPSSSIQYPVSKIAIWAHSNGGQIALTTLEVLSKPIPTTLWAPVTAPFPYSILFFTDELENEGKATRKWLSLFEKDYDVFDFTLTKHLDLLTGPLQIHHGTADEAALKTWSDEFVAKLKKENQRREKLKKEDVTPTPIVTNTDPVINPIPLLNKIEYQYYTYPGADHNLRPLKNWNQAVKRDLKFFERELNQ